eukprot:10375080-Karenia_brevis.AAC.1
MAKEMENMTAEEIQHFLKIAFAKRSKKPKEDTQAAKEGAKGKVNAAEKQMEDQKETETGTVGAADKDEKEQEKEADDDFGEKKAKEEDLPALVDEKAAQALDILRGAIDISGPEHKRELEKCCRTMFIAHSPNGWGCVQALKSISLTLKFHLVQEAENRLRKCEHLLRDMIVLRCRYLISQLPEKVERGSAEERQLFEKIANVGYGGFGFLGPENKDTRAQLFLAYHKDDNNRNKFLSSNRIAAMSQRREKARPTKLQCNDSKKNKKKKKRKLGKPARRPPGLVHPSQTPSVSSALSPPSGPYQ